jgi:23S rRNA pseudouridine1911/1915/1917 synthase
MPKTFQIEATEGLRLDHWLTQKFPEESRSYWQKKVKNKEVLVNNKKSKPHYSLRLSDQITINLKTATTNLTGEDLNLSIIFEDKNYAIIDKPAGLVVHPGAGHKDHTLVHGLIHYFGQDLSNTGGAERPGIVHRLDKDTSGLLIIAKNNQTHRTLSKQFEEKTIEKTYIALLEGHLSPEKGSIEAPLNRNKINRQKISISTREGSRYALSHYLIKEYFKRPLPCSLVEINIETGRTHQIRVHFESIGFPVLGDSTYGHAKANSALEKIGLHRQFLHAARLKFISPTTKKEVAYESALTEELSEVLNILGRS